MFALHGLIPGHIERRYKRFLADVRLADGTVVVAHCTNTGTMKTCWEPDDPVLLRFHEDPRRKLAYTLMAVCREGVWIGVDTGIPNKVVAEAARQDRLPGLAGLREVRTEVRYGSENSRIDVLARDGEGRLVYIEVKNTTLREGDRITFPDAVTSRGAKHLRELEAMVREGHCGVLVFYVHRGDGRAFDAARGIDPAYAVALDRAAAAGVRVLPILGAPQAQEGPDGTWTLCWDPRSVLPWEPAVEA